MNSRRDTLKIIYSRLYKHFGPQNWWPGDTRLEIIIGAILTQNTAWTNVEKAIANLKSQRLLSSAQELLRLEPSHLARLVRPSGYYNIKSARIRNFLVFLAGNYASSLRKMSFQGTKELRDELLKVNGIGPETCDSILLYAFKRPVFVVDSYTKRIFSRHGIFRQNLEYDAIQKTFMSELPADERLYNEYHALIVALGKEYCRTTPDCKKCPIKRLSLAELPCI